MASHNANDVAKNPLLEKASSGNLRHNIKNLWDQLIEANARNDHAASLALSTQLDCALEQEEISWHQR